MNPRDHAVVVTGAASGLGEETAIRLARAGARVAVLDLNGEAARKTASIIGGIGIACDVSDSDSTTTALKEAREKNGPARVVVNCAGIGTAKRIVGRDGPMPLGNFQRVISVNLIGTFNVMRLAAAEMAALDPLDDKERGMIISTASVAARPDRPGRLCRFQGRRCCFDDPGGARVRSVWYPSAGDRSGIIRDADVKWTSERGSGKSSGFYSLSAAPWASRAIRRFGSALHPKYVSQRRGDPPRRRSKACSAVS